MSGFAARRRRIAFLTNDLSNTYQARFLTSIEHATKVHDVDLLVLVGRQLGHPHTAVRVQNVLYSEWLNRETIDGVVSLSAAIGTFVGKEGLLELRNALHPIPLFSIGVPIAGAQAIVIENRAGMRVAVQHLLRHHGCRRIAYVSGPAGNAEAMERLSGYEDALEEAGLEFDPELVASGDFTTATGREAMAVILERTRDFDGLAVANDEMAIGAVELLREQGLRISEDVLVTSFDDTPKARYAVRPLTSVSQPTDRMADHAVRSLLGTLGGHPGPEVTRMEVELVLRESCGCGMVLRTNSLPPREHSGTAELIEYLGRRRNALLAKLEASTGPAADFWRCSAAQLLAAFEAELAGRPGVFARAVEDVGEDATEHGVTIDAIARKVAELRAEFAGAGLHGNGEIDLDKVWMKAQATLSAVTTRAEGKAALRVLSRANELRHVNERLSTALGPQAVAQALQASLEALGAKNAFLALAAAPRASALAEPEVELANRGEELEPLLALRDGHALELSSRPYPARQLFPDEFLTRGSRASLTALVLSFEDEVLGLMALDSGLEPFLSEALRSQLAASLKLSALHARVLEETALRERLAHEQLLGEMAIAKRLQTALAPKRLDVPALQIAASMHPADQVGGDYYDVLPIAGGCWIGFGDVTGHGLLSGLVMLMIQSIVSTLVGTRPNASPAELVVDLNAVLFPNIRERLGQDEHATLMLLRYFENGALSFAGAHEEIIVYRKALGRCELVPTSGIWLAVRPDVRQSTRNEELTLRPGDLMVLYTDGVIEARNSHDEHFGIERVCRIVKDNADDPVEHILNEIVGAVRAWFPVQQDDVTCLVARYTGAPRA